MADRITRRYNAEKRTKDRIDKRFQSLFNKAQSVLQLEWQDLEQPDAELLKEIRDKLHVRINKA